MLERLTLRSPEATVADQAAAWFARQRVQPWSEADSAEFAAWLKADPTHTTAWASFEQLWGRLDAVRGDPKILAIREAARRRAERQKSLRRGWRIGAQLAASVVVGVALWWGLKGSERATVRPPTAQSAVGGIGAPSAIRDASTEIGEHSLLLLTDGSKITLNTASAVRTDYSGRERRVTLIRGEAFFDVAKDPTRPFVVLAGPRQVIAVGTAFDVRLENQQLQVTLLEGKVRVLTAAARAADQEGAQAVPAVTLEAGSALIARDDGADRVERLDAARATSWRTGKLVFDGERLADVIAEMNRYSQQKLEIANSSLEERKVSGVFEPSGGPAFAKALEAYGIARATRQTATTIVLDSP